MSNEIRPKRQSTTSGVSTRINFPGYYRTRAYQAKGSRAHLHLRPIMSATSSLTSPPCCLVKGFYPHDGLCNHFEDVK